MTSMLLHFMKSCGIPTKLYTLYLLLVKLKKQQTLILCESLALVPLLLSTSSNMHCYTLILKVYVVHICTLVWSLTTLCLKN